jgi:hypothetical protein
VEGDERAWCFLHDKCINFTTHTLDRNFMALHCMRGLAFSSLKVDKSQKKEKHRKVEE